MGVAVPQTLLRWFERDLEPGEQVASAANADLWLRYRRIVLTDRRILVVQKLDLLHPLQGRTVESIPIDCIRAVRVQRSSWVTAIHFKTANGPRSYWLLNRSLGTGRFADAVETRFTREGTTPAQP